MVAEPAVPSIGSLPSLRGRLSLREEITSILRGAVMSGELVPGTVYSAPSLAERFGVSATPVREAMLDLSKEGLVDIVRNKGFRVVQLSAAELDDLTEIRSMLEVPVVRRLAADGVDADALDALRPLAAAVEDAALRRDFIAHVTLDLDFHLGLLGLSGNARLVDIVRTLRQGSRLYGLRSIPDDSVVFASFHEHAELLDLIAARDPDGAEALMRRHIGHVRGIWADPTADEGT
ncbi:MAG: GntR family transcriptional regulator [Chloroflexota bacterium]